jgi:hypothetical protein
MRRVLVIILIVLFPLQVSAACSDYQSVVQLSAAERLMLADTAVYGDDGALANWDTPEEPPASADVNDSIGQDLHFHQTAGSSYSQPQYIPPADHLLFLPVAKPPPVV